MHTNIIRPMLAMCIAIILVAWRSELISFNLTISASSLAVKKSQTKNLLSLLNQFAMLKITGLTRQNMIGNKLKNQILLYLFNLNCVCSKYLLKSHCQVLCKKRKKSFAQIYLPGLVYIWHQCMIWPCTVEGLSIGIVSSVLI